MMSFRILKSSGTWVLPWIQIVWGDTSVLGWISCRIWFVGNSPIIILFQEVCSSFPVDTILELGKVNQFFFIVQRKPWMVALCWIVEVPCGLYRIGILHKLATYRAEIPLNYLFDKSELRDFILITACNAMFALKEVSQPCFESYPQESLISSLYSIPRHIAIETMLSDYRKSSK